MGQAVPSLPHTDSNLFLGGRCTISWPRLASSGERWPRHIHLGHHPSRLIITPLLDPQPYCQFLSATLIPIYIPPSRPHPVHSVVDIILNLARQRSAIVAFSSSSINVLCCGVGSPLLSLFTSWSLEPDEQALLTPNNLSISHKRAKRFCRHATSLFTTANLELPTHKTYFNPYKTISPPTTASPEVQLVNPSIPHLRRSSPRPAIRSTAYT